MRLPAILTTLTSFLLLAGCMHKGSNPDDPYESVNRKIHGFNTAFDNLLLKPPAIIYKTLLPAKVRASINNFYNNINEIPTVANDILQWNWHSVSNDAGRFVINSTLGIGGLFDVAQQYHLPPNHNDLGLTFARWGDKKSPYIVIPLLGPSTIRDGMAMTFEYTFLTPYPYIKNNAVLYSLLGLRYVDLRSQFLETDRYIGEALDKYAFIRDAYLQHRNYLINGQIPNNATGGDAYLNDAGKDYVDDAGNDYVDDMDAETPAAAKTAGNLNKPDKKGP